MCGIFCLTLVEGSFSLAPDQGTEPMDWSKLSILSTLVTVLFSDHFHAGGWPCLGKSWTFHSRFLIYCRKKSNTWIQMRTKQVLFCFFFRLKFYIREKERGQGAGTAEKKKKTESMGPSECRAHSWWSVSSWDLMGFPVGRWCL